MPTIPSRAEVQVYVGAHGHVCIKQETPGEFEMEWATISLEPELVPKVIQWMRDALPEAVAAHLATTAERERDEAPDGGGADDS